MEKETKEVIAMIDSINVVAMDSMHKTALFINWRRTHKPTMRRESPVGITKNSGSQRVYSCICGAWDSECPKWRQTKHVAEFIARHNRECWPVGR